MKMLAGKTVLLTGASGGLGVHMARAFASQRANLALVAFPGTGLDTIRLEVERCSVQATCIAADLRDPVQRRWVFEQVKKDLGGVDVLVNNAGVEFTSAYHNLSEDNILDVLSVNLEAAMIMTWLVLPDMLRKGCGHIVNISSLAGKAGPAFQEPYSATKAGLIAFTSSLRATYRSSGVSASVIVPAFVEAGIYARLKQKTGRSAPALLTGCSPEHVAKTVLRAIQNDRLEIIVNRFPIRPVLALIALSPTFGTWVASKFGTDEFFRSVVQAAPEAAPEQPG